ncbi:MAG TPA: glycoside hydrolase family 30 beta sandwich domain-containing protein [Solirubrobacteraceae bacterium]|nr:glycoside hydrolase family 30 beta sandwich domain-containing protein [Solirubrobacteraceae bacterium]
MLGLTMLLAGGLSTATAQAKTKKKPKPKPSPIVLSVHVPKHHGPAVQTTLTTFDARYALRKIASQYFVTRTSTRPVIKINDHVRFQKIIGFGGAMTDSSAWLIRDELTAWQRDRVLRELFSPTQGIGLNVTRVPLGGSDFTANGVPYTYDDQPAGQSDPELDHFSIAHDTPYIIPALTEMLAANPQVRILSTQWSPPAWMKANDQLNDTGAKGSLLTQDYLPLAQYFVKFIRAYQELGVPIWAITPENEPLSSAQFPSMWLPEPNEAQFITQDLIPALDQNGLHPLVFGLDGSKLTYAEDLEHSIAASHLAGIAWHCYGGSQMMGQFHRAYPKVVNLTSECSPGIIPYGAAEATLSALNNSASVVELWNLALDPQGGPVEPPNSGCHRCTGLVVVDPATHKARLRRNYYQLGQFSAFIKRGAHRVAATRFDSEFTSPTRPHYGVSAGLDDAAFLDPGGRRVLVVYNNTDVERYFAVQWDRQMFQYKLPPKAIVTFAWRPGRAGGATNPAS